MKLSCICITYNRPQLLQRLIECYLRQEYPSELCELIILDDGGQYTNQFHSELKNWSLISIPKRFATLGEKRNATISLIADDSDAVVVFDDDDIYLPWTLTAHAAALESGEWSVPSTVLTDNGIAPITNNLLYHGSWAFRSDLFRDVGGYNWIDNGEDKTLFNKFIAGGATRVDPIELGFKPFYIYLTGLHHHISMLAQNGYSLLKTECKHVDNIVPSWDQDYLEIAEQLTTVNKIPILDKVLRLLDV